MLFANQFAKSPTDRDLCRPSSAGTHLLKTEGVTNKRNNWPKRTLAQWLASRTGGTEGPRQCPSVWWHGERVHTSGPQYPFSLQTCLGDYLITGSSGLNAVGGGYRAVIAFCPGGGWPVPG